MEDATQIDMPPEESILCRFAHILKNHIDAGKGSIEISLTPATLAGGVLLVEREAELESGTVGPSDRYSAETLVETLEEIGVKANGAGTGALVDLKENGYVREDTHGRLIAQDSLRAFGERLDETFPGMQGLNLVAYLIQTVDEVISGRKAPEAALAQFDQTLSLQKAKGSPSAASPRPASAKTVPSGAKQKKANAQSLRSALTRRLRRRQTEATPGRPSHSAQPTILSAGGGTAPVKVKKVFTAEAEAEDAGTGQSNSERVASPRPRATSPDGVGEPLSRPSAEAPVWGEEDVTTTPPGGEVSDEVSPGILSASPGDDSPVNSPDGDPATGGEDSENDAVTPRGPEFTPEAEPAPATVKDEFAEGWDAEEAGKESAPVPSPSPDTAPSIPCPLCGSGEILEQKTEKARIYFTCSNRDCVFVSWGRPHAQICPACSNPYLVEGTGHQGETTLTCPRATCRYRRALSDPPGEDPPVASSVSPRVSRSSAKKRAGAPRRVVRRRVVQKKH